MPTIENEQVAQLLRELGKRLSEEGSTFRARGLAKAADTIAALQRPISDIWRRGGLGALTAQRWVGPAVALWLVELVNSGKIAELERLRRACFLKRS